MSSQCEVGEFPRGMRSLPSSRCSARGMVGAIRPMLVPRHSLSDIPGIRLGPCVRC